MVEWRAKNDGLCGLEEQFRRAEQVTQIRAVPVSATRRKGWGGVPRESETKYWPAPKEAPEVRGRWAAEVEFLRWRWRWWWRELRR